MLFNQQSFIAAITAFSLLTPTLGRSIYRRDDWCAERDIINDKNEHYNGKPSQLYETPFRRVNGDDIPAVETLRIMPLGASITAGAHSTPEDGYRKILLEHLVRLGHKVEMVGSQFNKKGSMSEKDGHHEGHPGARIGQVTGFLDSSKNAKPNVYLINAGTNDCQQNFKDMRVQETDMTELLDTAWKLSPKATILLSTVLASDNEKAKPGSNGRVTDLNVKLRNMIKKLQGEGKRIILADMNTGFITKKDLVEGVHPNSEGYKKMSAVWEAAILEAREKRMLQEAEEIMRIST